MPPKRRGQYTAEEVATHNDDKSMWVIMNRKVYDVTVFHKRHPGGPQVIKQMAGKDATAAATAAHKTILPGNLMWEFCIGSVVRTKRPEAAPAPAPSPDPKDRIDSGQSAATASAATPVAPPTRPMPKQAAPKAAPQQEALPLVDPLLRPNSTPDARAKPAAKKAAAAKAAGQAATAAAISPRLKGERSSQPEEEKIKKSKPGHLDKDDQSSVCSRSAQGSDDMHDSLSDREHSPREGAPHHGKEKSGVSAATDALLEKIRADPRLLRWSKRSEQQMLAFEVRRFIAVSLGIRSSAAAMQPQSPADGLERAPSNSSLSRQISSRSVSKEVKYSTKDLRHRVEAHADEFVESLLDTIQQPHPLGEDVLVAAIAALNKDEKRVAQFIEHIRVPTKHHGAPKDGSPQQNVEKVGDEKNKRPAHRSASGEISNSGENTAKVSAVSLTVDSDTRTIEELRRNASPERMTTEEADWSILCGHCYGCSKSPSEKKPPLALTS